MFPRKNIFRQSIFNTQVANLDRASIANLSSSYIQAGTVQVTGDIIHQGNVEIQGDLTVDTINEYTLDSGVTVESVLIKDALVDGRDVSTDGSTLDSHIANSIAHGTSSNILGESDTQTLTNKAIDADNNTITNIDDNEIKTGAGINASKISSGIISNTEFDFLNGLDQNLSTTDTVTFLSINSLYLKIVNNSVIVGDVLTGQNITTGLRNVVCGVEAFKNSPSTSKDNCIFGYRAMQSLTSQGERNTIIGTEAAQNGNFLQDCVFIGYRSGGLGVCTQDETVALGAYSLYNLTNGFFNTAVGFKALNSITGGQANTCMGYLAGASVTANRSTFYGYKCDAVSATDCFFMGYNIVSTTTTNAICIGKEVTPISNGIVFGTSSHTTATIGPNNIIVASTDNAIARFNGITGEVQNSLVLISDVGVLTIPAGIALETDIVNETTVGSGVTIDSVLIKDNSVTADSITTDLISEKTAAAGVTIDSVLIKDNSVTAANGVSIDGLLIKDNTVNNLPLSLTASIATIGDATNLGFNVGGANINSQGDILSHTGIVMGKLSLGSNKQILTADNTQSTGLKWDDKYVGGAFVSSNDSSVLTINILNQFHAIPPAASTVSSQHLNGFSYTASSQAVATCARVSTTLTVTSAGHGLLTGTPITLQSTPLSDYDGEFTISNILTNSFDITVPASGTDLNCTYQQGSLLKYTNSTTEKFYISCNLVLSATANAQNITLQMFKNLNQPTGFISKIHMVTSGLFHTMTLSGITQLTQNQYIWIGIKNTSSSNNLTFDDISVSIHRV